MASASINKNGATLLFIGQNGSGKSSFINKIVGKDDMTEVGDTLEPTHHNKLVMKYPITAEHEGNPLITYYDTQGFGDLDNEDSKIADAIRKEMKTADIVLMCYRLYGRVDRYVTEELKEIAQFLGNELMKHAILVFTWGDEYKIHCQSTGQINDEASAQEEIKRQMNDQISSKVAKIREVFKNNGIKDEIANNIPYCVTSIKEDKLPCTTEENWMIEFWRKCRDRCTPESAPFMKPLDRSKRHNYKKIAMFGGLVGGVGGAATGAAAGITIGALIGTGVIPIPGVGTAVGAAVGAAFGTLIGATATGTAAGAAGSTAATYVYDDIKEKKAKKKQ